MKGILPILSQKRSDPFGLGSNTWLAVQAAAGDSGDEKTDLFDRPQPRNQKREDPVARGDHVEQIQHRLDQLFGRDEDLPDDDLFLKRFLVNKVCLHPKVSVMVDTFPLPKMFNSSAFARQRSSK